VGSDDFIMIKEWIMRKISSGIKRGLCDARQAL
jgi:hypothetical protein